MDHRSIALARGNIIKRLSLYIQSGLVAVTFVISYASQAEAIPAFARAHQVPCTLCHVGFPKLNHFGMEFEHRGYRMPDQEGKYLWEQPIPFGGKINLLAKSQKLNWATNGAEPDLIDTRSSSFELFDWQLFSGGTLTPQVSYFIQIVGKLNGLTPDANDSEAGHDHATDPTLSLTHSTTEIRTEAVWVQINDLVRGGRLNLRAGLDHIDNHFLSSPMRLTHADYLIQIQHMLGASLHPMAYGIGINGSLPLGLEYNLGARNYSTSFDSKESNELRLGAFYGLLSKELGENVVSILVSRDRAGNENLDQDGATTAYGVSLDLHVGRLNLIPGFFWYHEQAGHAGRSAAGDDHTHEEEGDGSTGTEEDHTHDETGTTGHGSGARDELDIFSGTLEAILTIRPGLLATARYDFNFWDIRNDGYDRRAMQYVLSVAWYPYPNVRLVGEYSRLTTRGLNLVGEPGLMLLHSVSSSADLARDTALLMLEVDF